MLKEQYISTAPSTVQQVTVNAPRTVQQDPVNSPSTVQQYTANAQSIVRQVYVNVPRMRCSKLSIAILDQETYYIYNYR